MRDSTAPAAGAPLAEVVDIRSRRQKGSVTSWLSGTETVIPCSISELVAVQLGDNEAPWELSLVQRDEVWSQLQAAYLLDSLLWGYPIGSLLLCTVEHRGNVLVGPSGKRHRKEAPKGVFQLLDGQQRMNALAALFATADAEKGSYLLSLSIGRDLTDLTRRKKSVKRSLRYIRLPQDDEAVEERWRWLDVGKLYQASLTMSHPEPISSSADRTNFWLELASKIDDECSFEEWRKLARTEPDQADDAADRVCRLLSAWKAKSVPVAKLYLKDPTDVLQVFNRVNRAGTPVASDDIFFAAVRTLWADAQDSVARVSKHGSPRKRVDTPLLLPPMDALRLLTRMASLRLKKGDLVPLDIERLRGEKGEAQEGESELIREMKALSQSGSAFLGRLKMLAGYARKRSKLGYALHLVPKRLLDPVFAWAATHKTGELDKAALLPAWEFLVGATAFRYLSVFGPAFERICMEEAMNAGDEGKAFPLGKILAQCRVKWPALRRGQRVVVGLEKDTAKRDLVNANAALLLHFVQGVRFELPEGKNFDVEHIYPQALVDKMKWKGRDGTHKLQRHENARDVFRVGNLCILDREVNRSVGKMWPDEKLREGYPADLWLKNLFLTDDNRRVLEQTCFYLRDDDGELGERVPVAMGAFSKYVRARELRMFRRLERSFPSALGFAADATLPGGSGSLEIETEE